MKYRSQITLIFLFSITGFCVFAKPPDSTIELECTYKNTLDLRTTELTETIGTKHVSIKISSNQSVLLQIGGKGEDFLGNASEAEINTQAKYLSDNFNIRETFNINRYTGGFENLFQANNSNGLLHYGVCKSVKKKF